jgi:Ca2+-binding EF-hand superfamily protein
MMRGGFTATPGHDWQSDKMRMIFALVDTDGDGTISIQEFLAAHERIFKAMDSNKDGRLTLEQMQAFLQGMAAPPAR